MENSNESLNADDLLVDDIEKVFEIYIKLTSVILNYGYEYIRENIETTKDISAIEEALKVIDELESVFAELDANLKGSEALQELPPCLASNLLPKDRRASSRVTKVADRNREALENFTSRIQKSSAIADALELRKAQTARSPNETSRQQTDGGSQTTQIRPPEADKQRFLETRRQAATTRPQTPASRIPSPRPQSAQGAVPKTPRTEAPKAPWVYRKPAPKIRLQRPTEPFGDAEILNPQNLKNLNLKELPLERMKKQIEGRLKKKLEASFEASISEAIAKQAEEMAAAEADHNRSVNVENLNLQL